MSFEIWLFAIKKFAQSYDMAMLIYNQLPEDQKKDLQNEYQQYIAQNK